MPKLKDFINSFVSALVTAIAILAVTGAFSQTKKINNAASIKDVAAVKTEMVVYTDNGLNSSKEHTDKCYLASLKHADDIMEAHEKQEAIEREALYEYLKLIYNAVK